MHLIFCLTLLFISSSTITTDSTSCTQITPFQTCMNYNIYDSSDNLCYPKRRSNYKIPYTNQFISDSECLPTVYFYYNNAVHCRLHGFDKVMDYSCILCINDLQKNASASPACMYKKQKCNGYNRRNYNGMGYNGSSSWNGFSYCN